MQFEPIRKALEQVALEATEGLKKEEHICYFWDAEKVRDKERRRIEDAMVLASFVGDIEKVKALVEQREHLPAPKLNFTFKLVNPIVRLVGTKKIKLTGGKVATPVMMNVTEIIIPEDAARAELIEIIETEDLGVSKDMKENEVKIVRIIIKHGILDVADKKVSRTGQVFQPQRAMITAVSYGAMQTMSAAIRRLEGDRDYTEGYEVE